MLTSVVDSKRGLRRVSRGVEASVDSQRRLEQSGCSIGVEDLDNLAKSAPLMIANGARGAVLEAQGPIEAVVLAKVLDPGVCDGGGWQEGKCAHADPLLLVVLATSVGHDEEEGGGLGGDGLGCCLRSRVFGEERIWLRRRTDLGLGVCGTALLMYQWSDEGME